MKIVKKILITLLVVLVLIQFYRPEKNNSATRDVASFETETKVSKPIKTILESKCYDCHSNKTEYPWYSEVAPASFLLARHVNEGNEHFNISNWSNYSDKKKEHKLHELIEEVENDKMPLKSYTLLHGSITQKEKEVLINWAKMALEQFAVK